MNRFVLLANPQQAHAALNSLWQALRPSLMNGERFEVEVKPERRNSEQNALLWVWLTAFSQQLQWPVNGAMVKLSPDEWKDILSAAFKRESQRVAMGLDGGMVMLGLRTSKMNKRDFAEFMEFVMATAAARGVEVDQVEEA